MNDLSKKKVGDPVYGADGSEWRVTKKRDDAGLSYIFDIENGDAPTSRITIDGRYMLHIPPSFFSEPVRIIPAQGECDFSGYLAWDLVYFADGTSDVVTSVCDRFISAGKYLNMPLNGKDMTGKQIFFHAPPNLAPSNPDAFRIPQHIAERKKSVDWANVPIDTLVEVYCGGQWRKRYFAGVRTFSTPSFYHNGATSHTAEGGDWSTVEASRIRLANEENTK